MSFEVQDCNGSKLKVGDKVLYGASEPDEQGIDYYTAHIVKISEPDGDYDDERGRAVEVCPYVMISFDDTDEHLKCFTYNDTKITWADYPDGPAHNIYVVEDLEWMEDGTSNHN